MCSSDLVLYLPIRFPLSYFALPLFPLYWAAAIYASYKVFSIVFKKCFSSIGMKLRLFPFLHYWMLWYPVWLWRLSDGPIISVFSALLSLGIFAAYFVMFLRFWLLARKIERVGIVVPFEGKPPTFS